MTERYDAIVIGAGHNGLVCAAYIAKAGKKVLVLERSDQVGGAAITREFSPGFKVSACAHLLHMFHPKIMRDLALESHGFNPGRDAVKTVSLDRKGDHLTLDPRHVEGRSLSEAEKQAYKDFAETMGRYAAVLESQFLKSPPRLANTGLANSRQLAGMGWNLRFGLGKNRMREFLRIVGMNIHGLLDEHFHTESLKAAIAFDAILGTSMEPRMAGTVLTYLYRLAGEANGQLCLPQGGMGMVADALLNSARAAGATVRTRATVGRIVLDAGRAAGVVLDGGEEIRAPVVVSNADPKTTFLELVGARNLEAGFAHRIGNVRTAGRTAKLHLALTGLPEFIGLDSDALAHRLLIAPTRNYLDHAFNHSKYGAFSEKPAMEIVLPTIGDPTLAPAGKHVLSAVVQYAPYDLKGGWPSQKQRFVDRIIEALSEYAPDIKSLITEVECLTPQDIEAQFGMTGGHWHHCEWSIDQMFMMRPTYGAARYRAPIDGLYLCGAGCHPGGGVMGAAGHNAAHTVLENIS